MRCLLKSCQKCQGDLVLDGDEWRCWQCGLYYYPKPSEPFEIPRDPPELSCSPGEVDPQEETPQKRRRRRGSTSANSINSVIEAQTRSDMRWWEKNKTLIQYLDEGRSVKGIAMLVGLGERQIRVVRAKLEELRAVVGAPSQDIQ